MNKKNILIVGGGFAGLACAQELIKHDAQIHVTLLDKNNYNQFKPLLYQVATSALSTDDIACGFRNFFNGQANIDIRMEEVTSVDPHTRGVKTKNGEFYQGDYLVLSVGATVNFFDTPGAEQNAFPLYTLQDAENLRSRILSIFEDVDRDLKLIDQGALNFVIVGAGPTGVEVAGALAYMFENILPSEFSNIPFKKACIYLIDLSEVVLGAFSKKSQDYAAEILKKRGVQFKLGLLVKEVAPDHVLLSDGSKIMTRTVIWAGGLKAVPVCQSCEFSVGHGGRINVKSDMTIDGFPNIFILGDLANIPSVNGEFLPQLGSVAQQSGRWTAKNIIAEINGKPRQPFNYHDKGIMAIIGKDAAIAEIGNERHQFEGKIAFMAWLGVHAALLNTFHQKTEALLEWTWDYFDNKRESQIIDNNQSSDIHWDK